MFQGLGVDCPTFRGGLWWFASLRSPRLQESVRTSEREREARDDGKRRTAVRQEQEPLEVDAP
jgi:hypothetical protein